MTTSSSAEFRRFLSRWSIKPVSNNPTDVFKASIESMDEQRRPASLRGLSDDSITVLKRFLDHHVQPDLLPKKRRAAVMVGLFASRHGHLNVLLTRRSRTMRTYAGQTALPGGKMEPQDSTLEETARREAFEECGITRDRRKVHKLTVLSPFLSRGNLIVTPIVFFIADQTLRPRINVQEVDILFSHPLESFLAGPITRSYELPWFSTNVPYRLFEFPSKHSPIFGFTADILIEAAVVGYGKEPNFAWKAAGQLPMSEIISLALTGAIEFQTDQQASRVGKHDVLEEGEGSLLDRIFHSLYHRCQKSQSLSSVRNLLRPKL